MEDLLLQAILLQEILIWEELHQAMLLKWERLMKFLTMFLDCFKMGRMKANRKWKYSYVEASMTSRRHHWISAESKRTEMAPS